MAHIYRIISDIKTNLSLHKVGERLYKEGNQFYGYNYWPIKGGYPLWSRNFPDIENHIELIGETDKPKEYYIDRIYTQEYIDENLKEQQNQKNSAFLF